VENQQNINPPEDQPKAKRTFEGTKANLPKKKGKKIIIIVFIILLLVGLGIGGYFGYKLYSSRNINIAYCSNKDLVDKAKFYISNYKIDELKTLTDGIQKQKNYKKDPVCLYPLIEYGIVAGSSDTAVNNFNLFKPLYEKNKSIEKVYDFNAQSYEIMQKQVEFQSKQKKLIEENVFYGPEVGQ
jgi:hypothetical protein